jgi:P-type Mg2+ transporter
MTDSYWSHPVDELFRELQSSEDGLSRNEADERLKRDGPNELRQDRSHGLLRLFFARFRSPLLLILVFAALFSVILRDWVNAFIVLGIVFLSAIMSTILEHRASKAVENLRNRVASKSTVKRGGKVIEVPSASVVSGDLALLSAGSLVPADGIIIEALDCYVSQAILTGETFPVMKMPGVAAENATMA